MKFNYKSDKKKWNKEIKLLKTSVVVFNYIVIIAMSQFDDYCK